MPRKLYPGPQGRAFVRTGAFRSPREGDWYLSGVEPPEAYQALADFTLGLPFEILREATAEERGCRCCGQKIPFARK